MSDRQNNPSLSVESFDSLYGNLASAWESHQKMRSGFADIADLALSSARLDMARTEMWAWWKQHRIEGR